MASEDQNPRRGPFTHLYTSVADSLEHVLRNSNISNETLAYAARRIDECCVHSYGKDNDDTKEYFGVLDYRVNGDWVRIAIPWQKPAKGRAESTELDLPVKVSGTGGISQDLVRQLCNNLALELSAYLRPSARSRR